MFHTIHLSVFFFVEKRVLNVHVSIAVIQMSEWLAVSVRSFFLHMEHDRVYTVPMGPQSLKPSSKLHLST